MLDEGSCDHSWAGDTRVKDCSLTLAQLGCRHDVFCAARVPVSERHGCAHPGTNHKFVDVMRMMCPLLSDSTVTVATSGYMEGHFRARSWS